MGQVLSAEDVRWVIQNQGNTPVKGGPIAQPGAWSPIVTLDDYVARHYPPWGVIVRPAYVDMLVWYDASGRLWMIDVSGDNIAQEVAKAPYESEYSVIEDLMMRIQRMAEGLPSPREAIYGTLAIGAIALVLMSRAKRG